MWYLRAKHVVRTIDPEDEWDVVGRGELVFRVSNIRCDSTKNISHVAEENEEVIGALASGWCRGDNFDGRDVAIFSFDLAVDPKHRKKGVGKSLIEAALKYYDETKEAYAGQDGLSMMRVWVVNPHLFSTLESYGFELESLHAGDSAHYVRYT